MASSRRRAPADSEMRSRLIAAAADIIREHGHAALTSRTLAERLSLKRQILHYYFTSVGELLVLIVRDAHARAVAAFEKAAQTDDPLHAIWRMMNDQRMSVLALEALVGIIAGHDKARAIVEAALGEFSATGESSIFKD